VPQCGLCTSCLLCRLALHAAGLEHVEPRTDYRDDVKNSLDTIDRRKLYPLRATLDHVDRLGTCLAAEFPWEVLTDTFPELLEIQKEMVRHDGGKPREIADAYVRMYQTNVEEWERFPLGFLPTTV
jgi:hypothetical protein